MAVKKETIDARKKLKQIELSKTEILKRETTNIRIINNLKILLDKYSDLRFEQLLITVLGRLDFNRESEETLDLIIREVNKILK